MDDKSELPGRSPDLFPYDIDWQSDTLSFIHLRRADYARASFLDARVLTPQTRTHRLTWSHTAELIERAGLVERCHYIFHIGHVGSTLLSRLIGAHPRAFALREPLLLRAFATLHAERRDRRDWNHLDFEARLTGCLKLLSRTFEPQQSAIVKATSFVSEFAAHLLHRTADAKALLVYVSPESYLATIFGGDNSRREAKLLAPGRLRRLHARLGGEEVWRLASLSEGETVALGWACEMPGLVSASQLAGARTLSIDFDQFLAHPAPLLDGAFRHLNLPASFGEVQNLLAGPDMHRYSKAPEHAYDAALRREVLCEARALHGREIARGLAWLDAAATKFAPIRAALQAAQEPRSSAPWTDSTRSN